MTRAFVVGNGPSLKKMCLDKLVGEVTFAMNRIDLLYQPAPDYGIRGTVWRPTYYLFIEWIGVDKPGQPRNDPNDDVPTLFDPVAGVPQRVYSNPFTEFVLPHHVAPGIEHCFLRLGHRPMYEQSRMTSQDWRSRSFPNVTFVPVACEHAGMYSKSGDRPTAWHLPVWCKYGGTMNVALQFAFAMGYDPVYLIGCDLGIQPIERTAVADPNHFHPDYWTWEDNPLEDRDDTLNEVHEMAMRAFHSAGRRLYNASWGGGLEVHERVNFDELFQPPARRAWWEPASVASA